MEKKKLILLGVLGALILIFCVGMAMDTSAITSEVGLNKTKLTTADAGTTYSITINCSGVSNRIKIFGMDFIPRGGVQEFDLEEKSYILYGDQVGGFASFIVTSSGVVSYDSLLEGGVLLGEGTSTLKVIGHPITINATEVDQPIALGYWPLDSFLGWTEPDNTTMLNLVVSGQYKYSLYTSYTDRFAIFDILPTGVVFYDNSQIGIIEGNNTNTVKPVGHTIIFNATNIDQRLAFGYWAHTSSFMGWTEPGTTTTYNIVAGGLYKYKLYTSYSGHFSTFEILPTGVVFYDNSQVGIIEGNGTNTVKPVGHTITFDATDVDQRIAFGYWAHTSSFMGWTEPGNTTTLNLVVSGQYKYGLWTYFTHRFATFDILPTGVVSYDNSQVGIIEGNGTNTVKPVGHLITINASDVDQDIGLGYWALTGSFMGWTEPGSTRTYRLVVNGPIMYHLYVSNAYFFAEFSVKPAGGIKYDEPYEGVVKGNNTSMITPIGHPIIVDNTQTTKRVGVSYPGNLDLFLGYTEPGEKRTYYLVANTQHPFPVYVESSAIGQFRVYTNKSCSLNEFITAYGTIFINYDYDDEPPVTEINLSGTTGNNGWYTSDVQVALTASDEGTGVERTQYSFDGVNWIDYSGTFLVNAEGTTTIFYRSIDKAENVEIMKEIDINIDKTQPDTQLEMNIYYVGPLGDIYITSSTEFNLTGSDLTSGIEIIYYRINGGVWCEYSIVFTLDSNGLYTIEYYSVDAAGNEESVNPITVNLANFEVNSYLSKGEDNPITFFDIIFTRSKN